MTSYLEGGWFADSSRTRLRTAVVDGAADVAGMLLRAGVPAHRVLRMALRIRTLVVVADPLLRGRAAFGPRDRAAVAERLAMYTDDFPELQSFVLDCIERVDGPREMTALYLHLVHVVRMMQLLGHAQSPEVMRTLGLFSSSEERGAAGRDPRPAPRGRKAAARKSPGSSPSRKR